MVILAVISLDIVHLFCVVPCLFGPKTKGGQTDWVQGWSGVSCQVQDTLRKRWDRYNQRRGRYSSTRRRISGTVSIFTSVTEVPSHQVQDMYLSHLPWQQTVYFPLLDSQHPHSPSKRGGCIPKKACPNKDRHSFQYRPPHMLQTFSVETPCFPLF